MAGLTAGYAVFARGKRGPAWLLCLGRTEREALSAAKWGLACIRKRTGRPAAVETMTYKWQRMPHGGGAWVPLAARGWGIER